MKQHTRLQSHSRLGVTLLEMTVVILVLLTLIGMASFSVGRYGEWKLGREAGETLRSVHAAQRLYLADRPTTQVQSITAGDLLPYLPGNLANMPTVTSLDGYQLSILVNTNPPVVDNGSGGAYDPSGSSSDSLWDIGQ